MNARMTRRLCTIAATMALVVAACSGSEAETDADPVLSTAAPEITVAATTTATTTEAEITVAETAPTVAEPVTERWLADVRSVASADDGSHAVSVVLIAESGGNADLTPVTLRVSLYDEWSDCDLDPESWTVAVSPSEHPRVEQRRSWEFRGGISEITGDSGGDGGMYSASYELISGGQSAVLTLTANTMPGCGETERQAAAAEPGEVGAESGEDGDSESGAGADAQSTDPETDEAETTEDDETTDTDETETTEGDETTETDQAETTEDDETTDTDETETTEPEADETGLRIVDVQLRRWDHTALIDLPLWSHCPPEPEPQWLRERMDRYRSVWDGWDSEVVDLDGYHVASGWWTDEQLGRWLPGAGVTAETAREHAAYHPIADTVGLWPDTLMPATMPFETPPHQLPTLTAALQHRGHNLASFADLQRATSRGIAGAGAWPQDVHVGKLLTSWVRFRMSQPPTIHEPVAWPLRSLFEARESTCAGEALIAMCASGETPSPMLASDHPIGRVLRSLACGE